MEGSSEAGGHHAGEAIAAGFAQSALFAASRILEREAHIRFTLLEVRDKNNFNNPMGTPVIGDPSPPPGADGRLGDVDAASGISLEASDAAI
jgi:hypothetical protein